MKEHLQQNVHGTAIPVSDDSFAGMTDLDSVCKAYKVPLFTSPRGSRGQIESPLQNANGTRVGSDLTENSPDEVAKRNRHDLEMAALGAMALRGS